jgi:uncharacterized RDD family membrane protein YckC
MSTDLSSPAHALATSGSDETLRVAGLTGVEIELEIAGPGSRSYAFLIDWHIRVLLALAWIICAWLVGLADKVVSPPGQRFLMLAFIPALLIYLLYQPVMELAMRGRTPGKRMASVRLVTRRGGTPSVAALLIRNVFRLVDCLPSLYLVGLACCFATRQRVRIGDLAAGTLLIVDVPRKDAALSQLSASLTQHNLSLLLIELAEELLERWSSLSTARRRELAAGLLTRAGRSASSDLSDEQLRTQLRELLRVDGEVRS